MKANHFLFKKIGSSKKAERNKSLGEKIKKYQNSGGKKRKSKFYKSTKKPIF